MSKTVSLWAVGTLSRCATSIGATVAIVSSLSQELLATARQEHLRQHAHDEDEAHQDERSAPRLCVERRIGLLEVLEDRERNRLQRLARVPADLVRRQRAREEQRRRLAGCARDGET